MKHSSVLKLIVCLFLSNVSMVFAQSGSTAVLAAPEYDTFAPPPVGGTYTDPVFGSTIKRVSSALVTANADQGGNLTWIENEYSTAAAFNSNNSNFILVHQSYFGLYSGTGIYLHALPLEIGASSEPRWSRKDNVTLYYHSGNMLKSYNVSTGAISVVHTFSEYSSISGNGEMDISLDGDHFVFAGDKQYIFVYQISTDTKFTVFNTGGTAFDSLYITPKNEVIVSWYPTGTARYNGQELFDINMNFLRQVGHADGHKHLTVDANGSEVLIWTNSNDPQPIPNCQNGIVKIVLATAAQTCLAQLDWSLAVHITAGDGNGSAYVETYAPGNPEPNTSGWKTYTNELLQVKLDGSGVIRLAHHRSRPWNTYNYEPKMTASRDGSRLLYASNYNLQGIDSYTSQYSDEYMILLNTAASAPAATIPSTPTSTPATPTAPVTPTVVRYEQGSDAVQYTGSWYPNAGAFNSGGSAVLAMNAGSQATFTFTGTGVHWIGYSDQWSGIAQVYVDGKLVGTVDTYAASEQAQAVQYAVNNLTSDTHTLTISVTGQHDSASSGAWVWVDAFDVIGSGPIRVAENGLGVTYTGSTWYASTSATGNGGAAVLSTTANARATLTFTGTGVTWIGYNDQYSGIAQVYVDGVEQGTVDTFAAAANPQAVNYSITGLTRGLHTLAIQVTGTKDASSTEAWVWVDAFNVTP